MSHYCAIIFAPPHLLGSKRLVFKKYRFSFQQILSTVPKIARNQQKQFPPSTKQLVSLIHCTLTNYNTSLLNLLHELIKYALWKLNNAEIYLTMTEYKNQTTLFRLLKTNSFWSLKIPSNKLFHRRFKNRISILRMQLLY